MIDRDTAMQWANDAGFVGSIISLGYELATPEQIQALITRAQNEAFETAATNIKENNTAMTDMLANDIRSLKTGGEA
jgi:hypothetical protein